MSENGKLDREELRRACYRVARSAMWSRAPTDVERIQEVADSFYQEAVEHEEFVTGQGREPNVILRCVQYLERTHAFPGTRESNFRDMFQVLIELAVPNTGARAESEQFYRDIEAGLACSRLDYDG